METVRRPKWHPPPPPQTPRILHLPRPATRRRPMTRRSASGVDHRWPPTGQLETLFGQERTFCYTIPPVFLLNSSKERGRVEEEREEELGIWEEKWRFQAEMLRAECKFLRMEREISAKRLERERAFMERTLKSSIYSLISAKRKIGEAENVSSVLEEEIEELKKKLADLHKSSKKATRRDPELLKENRSTASSESSSFDKGATLLQKQLQRIGGFSPQKCNKDLREIAKASLFKVGAEDGSMIKECVSNEACNRLADVEVLRRKMEGLSKGKLLKKMEEEYGLMESGASNSASTSKLSSSVQEPLQEGKVSEENICAGQCKVLVRRIMEQVRAETEQWSQMQEMLGQVREEMEELQASRNFWEDQALDSDYKIKSLSKNVQEWKQKAISLEVKEKQLEDLVKLLQEKLERERAAPRLQEKENKALTCRVKGNKGRADENCLKTRDALHDGKKATRKGGSKFTSPSRLPFMDIGNLSPLVRQNSRRSVFPLQSP